MWILDSRFVRHIYSQATFFTSLHPLPIHLSSYKMGHKTLSQGKGHQARGKYFDSKKLYTTTPWSFGFLSCQSSDIIMDLIQRIVIYQGNPLDDHTQYIRLLRRLMYLTLSRSNITYVMHKLSHYMKNHVTHIYMLFIMFCIMLNLDPIMVYFFQEHQSSNSKYILIWFE